MSALSERLFKLAIRMRDVRNLMGEDLSVDPHLLPGMLTDTMGGPKLKQHRPDAYVSPLGIASAEGEEDETQEEDD